METVSRGPYFVTIHDGIMANFGCFGPCREYTLLRDNDLSRPKGWFQGDTKVGPALEVAVTYHQDR